MSANHRFETLAEIAGSGSNIHARCACGHAGVIDGRRLARYFFVRRWNGRKHMIGDHLRCSICGQRPARVAPTFAAVHGPGWGPATEGDWKRLVARLPN